MNNTTNSGWIKIYKKLLNSDMYRNLNSTQRDVMLTCLLLANYEPKQWEWKGKIYTVQKGEFITSLKSLKKHCGKNVSIQEIRTALQKLEIWSFLTRKTTNRNTLISIVNYKVYQCNDLVKQQTNNKQTTNKQQLLRSIKNIKNKEKDNKEKKITFNSDTEKFENITSNNIKKWKEVFSNVDAELKKMEIWLASNPEKRKKNYEKFIFNWLSNQKGGKYGKNKQNNERYFGISAKTEEERFKNTPDSAEPGEW